MGQTLGGFLLYIYSCIKSSASVVLCCTWICPLLMYFCTNNECLDLLWLSKWRNLFWHWPHLHIFWRWELLLTFEFASSTYLEFTLLPVWFIMSTDCSAILCVTLCFWHHLASFVCSHINCSGSPRNILWANQHSYADCPFQRVLGWGQQKSGHSGGGSRWDIQTQVLCFIHCWLNSVVFSMFLEC